MNVPSTLCVSIPPEGGTVTARGRGADYAIDASSGCWIWQRGIDPQGYPRLAPTKDIKERRAHREYYRRAHGPIPAGYEVHHKCKTPLCVNPDHLQALPRRVHHVESFLTDRAGGLTLDDIREIRRLGRIQGYTSHKVAEMFGIHWRTVDDYWGSRRWAAEFNDGPCRPVCECEVCGGTFVADKHRDQVYCSAKCKQRAYYMRSRKAA